MGKLTGGFGLLLTILGVAGYIWTTETAAIWFGLVLIVCGFLAETEDRRRRMIVMHVAVLDGFLAFALPAFTAARAVVRAHRVGGTIEQPLQQRMHGVIACLCLVYVLLCVGSFLSARRSPPLPVTAEA